MNLTPIEWTTFSANPLKYRDAAGQVVWGCVHASPGCQKCYSEALAKRYGRGGPFNVQTMAGLTPFLDDAECHKMRTAKQIGGVAVSGSCCFIGDMTDIFGEWVSDDLLNRLFSNVLEVRTDVTWQILTKRAARMRDYLSWRWGEGRIPSRHIHVGVSVENQHFADARIPLLLQTPAAVRFISAEPLLGPIDVVRYIRNQRTLHVSADVEGMIANRSFDFLTGEHGKPLTRTEAEAGLRALLADGVKRIKASDECVGFSDQTGCPGHPNPRLDWIICGGESGPGARPCDLAWVRSIVAQCQAAGVPVFVKQLGANPVGGAGYDDPPEDWKPFDMKNRKGSDMSEWPEDLRVRQVPPDAEGPR